MDKQDRERTRKWLNEHLERNETDTGWYAYKLFGAFYAPRKTWKIEPGATIEVGRLARSPFQTCAPGIHAAPIRFFIDEFHRPYKGYFDDGTTVKDLWKVEIFDKDLHDIVVPYSGGKFRTRTMRLVGIVGVIDRDWRAASWDAIFAIRNRVGEELTIRRGRTGD